MHKKGMTMVELLGAVVLFGIILSLSAIMISVITNANAKVVEKSRANTEGTLLTSLMDKTIRDFGPTNYQPCGDTQCILLIKAFEYIPDLENGTIDLVVYDPVQTLKLEVKNHALFINDVAQNIAHFDVSPSSTLTYSIQDTTLNYVIQIILIGEHDLYTFRYEKSLQLETIPA